MNILDQEENKNYLDELVGEGKKYRDINELAKAYYNADTHIKTLERSNDELRTSYLNERADSQQRTNLADLVKQLQGLGQGQTSQSTNNPVTEVRESLKMEDVLSKVNEVLPGRLREIEEARRQQDNAEQVRQRLQERYGDQFGVAVREQIKELGLTEERFNALSRESPQAVYKALGLDQKPEGFQAPPRSNAGWQPKPKEKKTWTYWQQLKKENPKLYHDPKTINDMTQAHMELGSEFEDGDYHRWS